LAANATRVTLDVTSGYEVSLDADDGVEVHQAEGVAAPL
jgi:hypothetical protein